MADYFADGDLIDYTPGSAVVAGQVVMLADLFTIAPRPIAANALGAVAVEGLFTVAKATGTGSAIAQGAIVYWDGTAANITPTGTVTGAKRAGKAAAAASATDTTVRVLLNQG